MTEPDRIGLGADEQPDKTTQLVIDKIHASAAVEAGVTSDNEFGRAGRRFDRRAPFYLGFVGATGVACAFGLAYVVIAVREVLVLVALAFFIALGLDPAVRWLHRRGLARGVAVALALGAAVGVFALFLAFAVPLAVTQAGHLASNVPGYLNSLKNHHTTLGRLNYKYHIIDRLQALLKGEASFNAVLSGGKLVIDLIGSVVLVIILTVYLLVDLPRVKRALYQLAPRSRRARLVLLTDEIFGRVGGYVLGDVFTSFIAGLGTLIWSVAFGIPYAVFLGLLVALLDLIPMVGSTVGGVIVSIVALTVSLPLAIATAVFYVVYRFVEDYFLTPKVMAHTVAVPGLVTVIATVVGGALLGIIGAVVAIPVAAAVKLLLEQVAVPSLEQK